MQHTKSGIDYFCIFSIRDPEENLIKIQTCKSDNIRRVLRFYRARYPDLIITPIIHFFKLRYNQEIDDVLKEIDNQLSPAPVYNHNYTPRANTIRIQKFNSPDKITSKLFRNSLLGGFLDDYDEYEIYEDYHQQDETGDPLSYCDEYTRIKKYVNEHLGGN